jgi:NADPH2:quinone reductase
MIVREMGATLVAETSMVAAVRVHKVGGPEVLTYEDISVPEPGPGEVLIKQRACGINYVDAYYRAGAIPAPGGLPFIAGNEAAGEVIAVGDGVKNFRKGDRVAYVTMLGCYAAERVMAANRVMKLPSNVSYEHAASIMVKGMTAQVLLRRTFKVEKGHTVLVHSAAAGIGLILCQWANQLGATVIGAVGSDENAQRAKANGCHHALVYGKDFADRLKKINGGTGCDVVYDGVGKDTFAISLDCLRPLGLFVNYANTSGPIKGLNMNVLEQKGSLFATRPALATYIAANEDLTKSATDLFAIVGGGAVKIPPTQRYRLRDATKAHQDLENRTPVGFSILIP